MGGPYTRYRIITEDVDARVESARSGDATASGSLAPWPCAWGMAWWGRADIWPVAREHSERGMGYAAILVHVDADEDSDPRTRLARELAARCDATLIGAGA